MKWTSILKKEMDTIYQKNSGEICFAETEEYGNVVLKINKNADALISEYHALLDFAGDRCCRVYEFSEEEGFLLEEQIIPGSTLREGKSFHRRMDEFARLFLSTHPILSDRKYKTYLQWIQSAAKFCESHHKENNFMDFLPIFGEAKIVTRLAESLYEKYNSVLLHGDLHHDNIVKKPTGIYCMIDPKGVIGPSVFDVGRFLLNEIDCATEAGKKEHITKAIQILGEELSFSIEELLQVLYIEAWLACVWDLEDGNSPEDYKKCLIFVKGLYEEILS